MMATIEDLPKELMLEIFSHYIRSEGHEAFLKNIPLVCKDWNKLSSDSSLWRNVRARDWNFLQKVSQRGFLYNTLSLECDYYNEGYSDMKLSVVLKNIRDLKVLHLDGTPVGGATMMHVTEHCPHLERLRLWIENYSKPMSRGWDQFLTVCGPTLKHLVVKYNGSKETAQQHLLSRIAAKCPLLETLSFTSISVKTLFPIHKLRSGCPVLRELEIARCRLITTRMNDSLGCGFKYLKKFKAIMCDFNDLEIYSLFKDSVDLEHFTLYDSENLVFGNISEISSEKVRILDIMLRYPDDEKLEAFGDAVWKWRRTLSVLKLRGWDCNVSFVLERFLQDNPNPQLEMLVIEDSIDPHFFKEFIQKCVTLIHLNIDGEKYRGREEIEKSFGISHEGRQH